MSLAEAVGVTVVGGIMLWVMVRWAFYRHINRKQERLRAAWIAEDARREAHYREERCARWLEMRDNTRNYSAALLSALIERDQCE